MDDSMRVALGRGCFFAGFGWIMAIAIWRNFSQEHSARMFWLHLTAPIIGSAVMLTGILLIATSDRFQKHNSTEPAARP